MSYEVNVIRYNSYHFYAKEDNWNATFMNNNLFHQLFSDHQQESEQLPDNIANINEKNEGERSYYT